MWYIFPQINGLGQTPMSVYYGIKSLEEAKAYLENSYLRGNLIEISQALVDLKNKEILSILGYPDNLKLQSCMTLFYTVDPDCDIFKQVIDKFYNGEMDKKTLEMLEEQEKMKMKLYRCLKCDKIVTVIIGLSMGASCKLSSKKAGYPAFCLM